MLIELLLLKIIKFNGDISPLIKMNYEYSQIVGLINEQIAKGNAEYVDGELCLTKSGNEQIAKLSKNRAPGSDSWIEPEIQSQIKKIEKDFIFLPDKDELSF